MDSLDWVATDALVDELMRRHEVLIVIGSKDRTEQRGELYIKDVGNPFTCLGIANFYLKVKMLRIMGDTDDAEGEPDEGT